ncbi:hypothetical protein FJT64_027441 [Amphibalanus amphitrite]|uniref:Peptidase A2 domain-containing protein n=1 Tax=Amphibalanus amphitrite TaxID=1232801 RepID=A0A6A4W1Y5_AMPAM|nr:hypothetical protein FJT64_027441 [Amphibalanus amphitrite]
MAWSGGRGGDQLVGCGVGAARVQRGCSEGAAARLYSGDQLFGSDDVMELGAGLQAMAVAPYRQGSDFERWLKSLERYMVAMGVESTARKCALLLHLVGPDIADLSDSLPEEPDGQAADNDFVRLKTKLTKYLVPTRNVVAERSKFQAMAMEENEDLEVFLGRLRAQVQRCGYTAAEVERELRDRCVQASRGELQQRLVREAVLKGAGLTLEDVRRTARAFREVKDLAAQLAGAPEPAAAGEDTVQALGVPRPAGQPRMEMLVDTGSPVSIVAVGSIPGLEVRPSVMQLRSFTGQPVPVRGEATVDVLYGGQRRRLDVVVSSQLRHRSLLGRDWLQVIRLDWRSLFQVSEVGGASGRRTLESVKAAHAQVFADGLGVMSHQAHLTLKPGAVPRRLPPRPVPYALLPQVEAELDRWVSDGIAKKVDPSETSSGWGTPLVPVQVAIQDPATKRWSRHGVITDVGPHRRYYVRLPKGRVLTRNRRFLRQRYGHAAPDSPPPLRAAGSQGGEPPAAAA